MFWCISSQTRAGNALSTLFIEPKIAGFRFDLGVFGSYNRQIFSYESVNSNRKEHSSQNPACQAQNRAHAGCDRPACLSNRHQCSKGCSLKAPKTITLLLLLLPALAVSHAKPKKPYKLPALFNQARFVYVEALDGQEFDPRLNPDDVKAIGDLSDALYDWNRYVVVTRRDHADLIFVVRKGRLATTRVGVQAGAGPQGVPNTRPNGPGYGTSVGEEVGPRDDLLEVYAPNPNEPRGTLLWEHTLHDGLNPPELALFKQLKDEVEREYPNQAATKSSKP